MPDAIPASVDVLIVGAGPAGSSAAYKAAQAGLEVLMLDHKKQVGEPVQCAEFVPANLGKLARADGVSIQRVDAMKTCLPSGDESCLDSLGFMVNRRRFDQTLVERACEQGVSVSLGCRLVDVQHHLHRASIDMAGKKHQIKYKVLIAADGPASSVAHAIGLPGLPVLHTRQYTLSLNIPVTEIKIWLHKDYPGGYAWLFPKGQLANLGLGVNKHIAPNLKNILDGLHTRLVGKGVIGSSIQARTGGLIPVGGIRSPLCFKNIVFVGDAAGLTHPITGAGIYPAIYSGELAGEAIAAFLRKDKNALSGYEEEIQQSFEPAIQRGLQRRRFLDNYWNAPTIDDDVMKKGWVAFEEYFAA